MLTKPAFDALLNDSRTPLILDGGLATALEARQHDLNHPLWSARLLQSDPDEIQAVHEGFYAAGAHVATTASYQGSVRGLVEHGGLGEEMAEEVVRGSVGVAWRAREVVQRRAGVRGGGRRRLLVAGSVGPFGAFLADGSEYTGGYVRSAEEFKAFHRGRVRALVEAGVDVLALETMPHVGEVRAVLELLRDEFPTAIVWVSCSLRDAEALADGTGLAEVVGLVNEFKERVVGFGFNCVAPGVAGEALEGVKGVVEVPLVCYPNSGEEYDAGAKVWKGEGTGEGTVAAQVRRWQASGAKMIGGCCRCGPDYIAQVCEALEER